ncbi:DUF2171 domain-containing protein [Siccirubricoccus deserti]
MANAADLAHGEIPDHTPIIGSDGRPVGAADGIEGEYIKLMRGEDGQHRWLPRKLVAGLEGGQVRLSCPPRRRRMRWWRRRSWRGAWRLTRMPVPPSAGPMTAARMAAGPRRMGRRAAQNT